MNMHAIDWAICASLMLILVWVALIFRRFSNSVTGFLAANRCAGRYLICVAYNMAQVGIITLVWFFQQYYDSGWTSIWWGFLENPSMIALALTGWVVYRFRETRALTLAQFFEKRYSRRFRIFCGVVAFVAGVVNYSIFPAVSARFFMGLCGFPDTFMCAGVECNTFIVLMALLLSTALFFVFIGGQIVVMVTDFIQGVVANAAFLVIIGVCIAMFGWVRIGDTMVEQYWNGKAVTWQVEVHGTPAEQLPARIQEGMLGPSATLVAQHPTADGTGTVVTLAGRPQVPIAPSAPQGSRDQARPSFSEPQLLLDGQPAPAESGPPEGRSMVHPFGIQNESNFNIFYWLISAFILFYAAKAWQGDQGYNAAASSPHEAKMAQILAGWRWRVLMLVALVIPVCVKVFLHHPDFAAGASAVQGQLSDLAAGVMHESGGTAVATAASLKAEMRTPLALAAMLPVGILGLMAAAMLGAYISTDNTYLHSWGSILIQDVVLPFRRTPLSQRAHLWLLRAAIFGVAVFAFIVGVYYKPGQYIAMFGALTAAVFVAGAGVCIIGGLYWRRGTTTAAWTAMTAGMVCALFALVAKEEWLVSTAWLQSWSDTAVAGLCADAVLTVRHNAWLSGQVLGFFAIVLAVVLFIIVSLAGKTQFDLDRLLYRGRYRDALSGSADSTATSDQPPSRTWLEKLGFTREFTGTDKWVTWITIAWPLAWSVVFVVVTAYNAVVPVSDRAWMGFWKWWTMGVFALGIVIVVWFSIGGFRDLVRMYRRLDAYRVDETDDGTVTPVAERPKPGADA